MFSSYFLVLDILRTGKLQKYSCYVACSFHCAQNEKSKSSVSPPQHRHYDFIAFSLDKNDLVKP